MGERRERAEGSERTTRPWGLWSVRWALVVLLVGAGAWVYAVTTRPEPVAASGASAMAAGFGEGGRAVNAEPEPRVIDRAGPATFRLGAGFLAGFAAAWALKKFVKVSLLVAGLAVVGLMVLQRTGAVEVDFGAVERHLRDSFAWARGHASGVGEFLMGYLPTGGAAMAGLVVGARKA